MSMRDVPSSAYTVKATEFAKLFSPTNQAIYITLIDDGDSEGVEEFLKNNLPSSFPHPDSVFVFNAEMSGEEFEEGDVIVCFAEDDLFIKEKRPAMEAMEQNGINPEYSRWTVLC